MSLLERLEKGEQKYEKIPAALSEVQLPLNFSTRSGRCTIVGMKIYHPVRVDVCSPPILDEIQAVDVMCFLFEVSTPLEEIVSFMQKSFLGTPHRIQTATVILLEL